MRLMTKIRYSSKGRCGYRCSVAQSNDLFADGDGELLAAVVLEAVHCLDVEDH